IPALPLLTGPPAPAVPVGPEQMQNRFWRVMQAFLGVFAAPTRPLVMFLDDMQWADTATLELLLRLIGGTDSTNALFVLAYRDNEVDHSHPFARALQEIDTMGRLLARVDVGPLTTTDVCRLCCDTLRRAPAEVTPLATLIAAKTQGNPFFVIEFLKALRAEDLLTFDGPANQWTWSLPAIAAHNITDNVVTLMVERLRRLSPEAQTLLQTAACIGNTFEPQTLAHVTDTLPERVRAGLAEALEAGLLVASAPGSASAANTSSYAFMHDRVQQAAYALAPDADKSRIHLSVGRGLLANSQTDEVEARLFEIVNHYNASGALLQDASERDQVRALNRRAAARARASTAFTAALRYLDAAALFLPADAWARDYADTYSLHSELAEAAYLARDCQRAEQQLEQLRDRAASPLDRARTYLLHNRMLQGSGRFAESLQNLRDALAMLEIRLPDGPEVAQAVAQERAAVLDALGGRGAAELLDLPPLQDRRVELVLDLLRVGVAPFYIVAPELFPFAVLLMMRLTLEHGLSPGSAHIVACYGMVLAGTFEAYDAAYEFGQAALRLDERNGDPAMHGQVAHIFGGHINLWKQPMARAIPFLLRAQATCQERGDYEYANYMGFQVAWQIFESCDNLLAPQQILPPFLAFARKTNTPYVHHILQVLEHVVAQLRASGTPPSVDLQAADAGLQTYNFGMGRAYSVFFQLAEAVLMGQWDRAGALVSRGEPLLGYAHASPGLVTYAFYASLWLARTCDTVSEDEQARFLTRLERHSAQLDLWAMHCPANMEARAKLVRAERQRLQGDLGVALRLYEEAMVAARTYHLVCCEALANERAARVYLRLGVFKVAHAHLGEARRLFCAWGAGAVVRRLEEEFPALQNEEALDSTGTAVVSVRQLDMLSVLKASQTISGEMVLQKLLDTMMHIVIEYAGAQRGLLLLEGPEGLRLQAEARVGTSVSDLQAVPLDEAADLLAVTVVRCVRRTGAPVLLEDAGRRGDFTEDPYIVAHQPRSVLCLPFARHGQLSGVIYLENNLMSAAFEQSRLFTLELLAAQVAISIDNSKLYNASQEALRVREEFLAIASHELRTPLTPLQLQIGGLLRTLRTGGLDRTRLERMCHIAERQIRRLTHLIGDLLDVTRINEGKLALLLEEVDLAEVTREVLDRYAEDLDASHCTLDTSLQPAHGRWDRSRLEQVVSNLVANSIKYAAGRPLHVKVQEDAGRATLIVTDEGGGIALNHQARIFDRFERAAASKNAGGLGLGLFISRQIVLAHGGDIRVSSAPGAGATFTVSLPPAVPPAGPAP
ncbi:MAG TPA: ATP-binding protein, partial [Myxococcota bacterium]|nr:ATP-binding protein [Myxococcota bacterium]